MVPIKQVTNDNTEIQGLDLTYTSNTALIGFKTQVNKTSIATVYPNLSISLTSEFIIENPNINNTVPIDNTTATIITTSIQHFALSLTNPNIQYTIKTLPTIEKLHDIPINPNNTIVLPEINAEASIKIAKVIIPNPIIAINNGTQKDLSIQRCVVFTFDWFVGIEIAKT
mgnify:CR=1 FL=1